jgi:hypothetical protein
MKTRARSFTSARSIVAVLVAVVALGGSGCRKTRPPAEPESVGEDATAPGTGPGKKGPVPGADAGIPAKDPAPGPRARAPARADIDLVRADRPALGFPVPDGMRLVKKDPYGEAYESPYSVRSLERFFRREMGPDARIEKRQFGFRVVPRDGNGFLLVTQAGAGPPHVAVVRIPVNRSPDLPAEVGPLSPGAAPAPGPH